MKEPHCFLSALKFKKFNAHYCKKKTSFSPTKRSRHSYKNNNQTDQAIKQIYHSRPSITSTELCTLLPEFSNVTAHTIQCRLKMNCSLFCSASLQTSEKTPAAEKKC